MKTNVEVVQELLKGATQSHVVSALVADDAIYVSLTYDNPELKKIMPWAGMHKHGKSAILKTFTDVNRYWTVDPVVMRQQWTKAYQFLAGQAVNGMNEYAATDTGMKTLPGEGATARTVEISSILQKTNDTYQVRWVETAYSNGMRRPREEYTGLFQVKLMPPRDESDSFKNPIGVYITNFTWSREFSGAVLRDDSPRNTPNQVAPNPNNPDNGGVQ